ncbi:efflux RND transporter periplasmic adaptor subunit [Alisedimentitalea sp. MJ-SS2]|uniref:efflux RND transporter periplasmic adaptor subunit n=1 Tax=Aliisedimentitalea sp. MJ-SS2 TaxID=3049795 RepID=UPI00291374BF|nr:efflux RND transporter periplasmic adaptor subunit [Alisedimentitalea sp. MJ-SS2]MDU8926398.1 efflux RND transporter periplasmic adaptor subunit [Alisedimentitalea sp. MJ-SS2]
MRILPLLTALLVSAFLYFLIIDRETLLALARGESPTDASSTVPVTDAAPAQGQGGDVTAEAPVGVVAIHSQARIINSAVILRGQTEAARQVSVRAETSGLVISDPLRKGAFVEEGELLCRLDPGTRAASLAEARARRAEAQARIPEAEAQLPRAEAQLDTARAQLESARAQLEGSHAQLESNRAQLESSIAQLENAKAQRASAEAQLETAAAQLTTAKARLVEAEINYNAAVKLREDGYASDTRVASAEAAMRAAEGGVTQAHAGVTQAKAGVTQAAAGVTQAGASVTQAKAGITQARVGIAGAEANITQAEASVKSAQAGVKTAQSGILNSQAGVQSAEAGVAAAEKEISRLDIVAPFEGLLETDTAELGALLQPGAVCATVIQLDPIKLVGFVPETEITRVAVGSRAGAHLTTGEELTGRVTFLSRSADPLTRTFRVEIEVPNRALAIRDGQTVELAIASDGAPAHLVPQSALTLDDNGDLGVRIVDSAKHALFQPVTLLRDTAQGVWITGLPDKADVIVIGQEYVVDGVPVRASYQEPGQ